MSIVVVKLVWYNKLLSKISIVGARRLTNPNNALLYTNIKHASRYTYFPKLWTWLIVTVSWQGQLCMIGYRSERIPSFLGERLLRGNWNVSRFEMIEFMTQPCFGNMGFLRKRTCVQFNVPHTQAELPWYRLIVSRFSDCFSLICQ